MMLLQRVRTLLICSSLIYTALAAPASHAYAAQQPQPISWLVVDPRAPRTLYAGAEKAIWQDHSTGWAARSTDGGRTWTDLTATLHDAFGYAYTACDTTFFQLAPFVLSGDSHILYTEIDNACSASRASQTYELGMSNDGGLHWSVLGPTPEGNVPSFGYRLLTISPTAPSWLYALTQDGDAGSPGSPHIVVSQDRGSTWRAGGGVSPYRLLIDPRQPSIVYANEYGDSAGDSIVRRSVDGGTTWAVLPPPAATPTLRDFSVGTDTHEPGLLVGYTHDPRVPGDRIYVSADHGTTWRAVRCPGYLPGRCPLFTIDNAFGAGRSYAFFSDGIYAFQGTGQATARLDLSAQLPVSGSQLQEVTGGSHQGDPVYLVTKAGLLYRSIDRGHNWQQPRW